MLSVSRHHWKEQMGYFWSLAFTLSPRAASILREATASCDQRTNMRPERLAGIIFTLGGCLLKLEALLCSKKGKEAVISHMEAVCRLNELSAIVLRLLDAIVNFVHTVTSSCLT